MPRQLHVLVCEPGVTERRRLAALMRDQGCYVDASSDGIEACLRMQDHRFDVVVSALKMPGADGLEVLRKAKELEPSTAVIILTEHPSVDSAVQAMKGGASHYGDKSLPEEDLLRIVRAAGPGEEKPAEARVSQSARGGMVGEHPRMRAVFEMVQRVAASDTTVLITGESGTGKELVARAIHEGSERRSAHLVPVNCAAIPEGLLESELFGHVKGAFTGAHKSRTGRFALADGGSLFLDEIGEMPPSLQAKLLRVLQEREVEPVGGTRPIKIDVRVIAATNRNLEEMVAEGTFREDLFYRLSVIPVELPALRERKDDILVLFEHFVVRFAERSRRPVPRLTPESAAILTTYPWPGNVRELENLAERIVIMSTEERVEPDDIPARFRSPGGSPAGGGGVMTLPDQGVKLKELLADLETDFIEQALERTGGNRNQAARLLGLNRTTLVEKLKKRGR